jgi:hypothetical protein
LIAAKKKTMKDEDISIMWPHGSMIRDH